MKNPTSVNDLLKSAIADEEEAYAFYSEVAQRMNDKTIKKIFLDLAKDELGHKEFITKCMNDQSLLSNLPLPKDYKVSEATQEPALSVKIKPADAIALAMKKEQKAADLYKKLAAEAINPTYRTTFQGLATMELGHKTHLEEVFTDIGYPEVW